ncbi:hypothetical protein J437_LFUL018838 [Ladona fulva]|uniref:Integrase p58-like C-terminal domain-containing protein n=1 Tax=Ladona fulva TaxID=123851 RepID=A0A8K0PAJ2_LADFU|nr:hypothetical protein J437_LFUL018838 [Ladona fulva]
MSILSHFVDTKQRDWDDWLPFAISAYRSIPHSTTGESPHFFMHGRDIELSFDDITEPLRVNYATDSNYAAELRARLNIAFGKVRDRLQHAHQQQAKYYNRGSKEASFRPGDRVFLHIPFVGIGRKKKLSRQWQGPYCVLEQTSPVYFRVQHIFRPKDCQLVHANRLKIASGVHTKPLPSQPVRKAITNPPPPKTSTSPRAEMRQQPPIVLELDLLPSLPPEPPPSDSCDASSGDINADFATNGAPRWTPGGTRKTPVSKIGGRSQDTEWRDRRPDKRERPIWEEDIKLGNEFDILQSASSSLPYLKARDIITGCKEKSDVLLKHKITTLKKYAKEPVRRAISHIVTNIVQDAI